MLAIIKKEFKLLIHPACYLSFFFIFLGLIPNYPLIISFFFPLVVFPQIIFGQASEGSDYEFSDLLPISRADVVKGKIFDLLFFQVVVLVAALPIILIRNYVIYSDPASNALYYGSFPGVNTVLGVYGFAVLIYAFFDLTFITLTFKHCPKYIGAYLIGLSVAGLLSTIGIVSTFIPGLKDFFAVGQIIPQLVFFLICLAVGVFLVALTYRLAVKIYSRKN